MSLENLGNLGEFLGGIVVVVSLFYLAFQVRQNTQSIRAESYARALERLAGMQARFAGDADLSDLFSRGLFSTSSLTQAERVRFNWALYELFGAFEFLFHHAQKGMLDQECPFARDGRETQMHQRVRTMPS